MNETRGAEEINLTHPEYRTLADTGTLRRITPLADPITQQGNLYRCGDRAETRAAREKAEYKRGCCSC